MNIRTPTYVNTHIVTHTHTHTYTHNMQEEYVKSKTYLETVYAKSMSTHAQNTPRCSVGQIIQTHRTRIRLTLCIYCT